MPEDWQPFDEWLCAYEADIWRVDNGRGIESRRWTPPERDWLADPEQHATLIGRHV